MTDFFDAVAGKANQSQIDRLRNQYAKEKRDGLLNPFATYQGIDPIDGTDRVAINGEINSGFKLICNAPVSIGERVYLRKNKQGGLQRVDARNRRLVAVSAIEPDIPDIIPAFFLGLFYEVLITYTGGSTVTSFDGTLQQSGYNLEGDYIAVTEREEPISSDDIDYAYTGEAIFRNEIPYIKYAIAFENTSIGITLGRGVQISLGGESPLLTASTFAITTTITGYIKIEGFPEESTPPVNWTFDETLTESPQIFTGSYAVGAIPFEVWVNIEINSITFS
jgi:hypothetical protein